MSPFVSEEELALFGPPVTAAAASRSARSRPARGRSRETFVRRVTAEVTVLQASALRAAALRVLDDGVVVDLGPVGDDEVGDDEPAGREPREEIADSVAAALGWLVEPTAGLDNLLLAEAFQILDLELSLDERSPLECQLSWAVTVKLCDVAALRAIAEAACPAGDLPARAEVADSLAGAWNRAADPYAPLHPVPGIRWTGREVTVEQILARPHPTT